MWSIIVGANWQRSTGGNDRWRISLLHAGDEWLYWIRKQTTLEMLLKSKSYLSPIDARESSRVIRLASRSGAILFDWNSRADCSWTDQRIKQTKTIILNCSWRSCGFDCGKTLLFIHLARVRLRFERGAATQYLSSRDTKFHFVCLHRLIYDISALCLNSSTHACFESCTPLVNGCVSDALLNVAAQLCKTFSRRGWHKKKCAMTPY